MKLNKLKSNNWFRITVVILAALLLQFSYMTYLVVSTPAVIQKPLLEHYHFRMQILVNGKSENFAEDKYQKDYAKDQCSADLPNHPIHFHDNKDQFTHIHWEGITGGMVMKFYGWDYIGGAKNSLGFRINNLKNIQNVNIHGSLLPTVPKEAKFYIYTGDINSYKERSFNDWKTQDLEEFFGVTSNFPAHELNKTKRAGLLDKIFPKASAHGDEVHTKPDTAKLDTESEEQKLTRINNLVGNVVIFVQKDKPSEQQIKDRFNDLEPLTESTCGG